MRLYPLSGPIADARPSKMIPVKQEDDTGTSALISFRLPDPNKSRCKGTWSALVPKAVTHERGLSLTLRDTGGKYKNSVSEVGGVNSGELYAVCSDGARVQGQFISGSGTQSGTGTVQDTHGNTYKLLF